MSDLPAVDRDAMMGEAYRRGILPPAQRGAYEELLRRGAVRAPADAAGAPSASEGLAPAAAPPAAPGAISGAASQLRSTQESFAARHKLMEEQSRAQQGYEPGVDYDTGTGFTDTVAMKRAANPAEKLAYLESAYGKDSVFKDKRGSFYVVTPDGKRVSPEGTGFVNNFLSSLYADAPQIVGGTIGGVAGAGAGGPAGALGGAALGTAAGQAAVDAIKFISGQHRQGVSEQIGNIAEAGAYGAVGEGAGRMVTGIPGVAGRAFRKYITGATPESRSLAASVEQAGGVAPLRSATPNLRSPIQKQDISTRIGLDFLTERNQAATHTLLREIIENSGMSPAQRQAALAEILDPTARVSAQQAGQPIVGAIRAEAGALESEAGRLGADADRILSGQLSRLNALSRRSPAGALGEDVAGGISQARADFSTAMGKIYAQVDRLTGDAPVVPMFLVQKRADQILKSLPKDAAGEPIFGDARVLRSLHQLAGTEAAMPLGQAKAIRSTLGDFGELTDLTPGVAKRQFDDLRRAADAAIGQAAADPAVAPAIRLLRQADKTYADGIRKFGDAEINRMVAQAKTGVLPDPSVVADKVLQPGQHARAAEIKKMVGPDVWRRVAAADWDNVIRTATDPQTGDVSARKLAAAITARNRDGLLDLTYDRAIAGDMRLYSQRLNARGGKVPAGALAPDNFGQTMRQLEAAQTKQDEFLKTNYLSALAKPGPLEDDAVSFILRPGEESRLIQAQRHFGDTSPQMTGIREQALKELLNSAIVKSETGAGTTVAGEGIEAALRHFTPKQQDILFPGGLAADMRRLASEIRFMFPVKRDQLAGSLIAGMVSNLPLPARVVPLAYYGGLSWIFSQPGTVRALANGLRPGPGQEATRETIRMIFRAAAIGQLPDEPAEPEAGAAVGREAAIQQAVRPPVVAPPARPGGLRHSTGAE